MIMINHLFQWEWLSGWQNVPAYACNMSQRWNQYRPSRTCLYLCTSDIWICWFGRFAFVKPSRQVISTLPLERRWISPKKIVDFPTLIICICGQVIYPHLSEFDVFFTAHQSEFICPTHIHSALPTVWWSFKPFTLHFTVKDISSLEWKKGWISLSLLSFQSKLSSQKCVWPKRIRIDHHCGGPLINSVENISSLEWNKEMNFTFTFVFQIKFVLQFFLSLKRTSGCDGSSSWTKLFEWNWKQCQWKDFNGRKKQHR